MRDGIRFSILLFIIFGTILKWSAYGQDNTEWAGERVDGTRITHHELVNILEKHQLWVAKDWVESERKYGRQLQLKGADLTGVKLMGRDLRKAVLANANLTDANLSGADLRQADLQNVILTSAVLRHANLREAKLGGADLIDADLSGAKIEGIELEKAILSETKFEGNTDKLQKWKTVWELMKNVNSEKDLSGRDLSQAFLRGVDLSAANLSQTDLSAADLNGANLSHSNLHKADLRSASLKYADLRNSDLRKAFMANANLTEAKMAGVIFEPRAGSLPDIAAISSGQGLSKLRYQDSPHALIELREAFKKAGLLTQQRKITYAIKHAKRKALLGNGPWRKLEGGFNLIFFELTCLYGMKPGRPLILLLLLICILTVPYTIALMWPPEKEGIWQVWFHDRVHKYLGSDDPVRLQLGFMRALKTGFFFSFLSAFSIGWREINIRNWIVRLQRQEYNLRATGWVRTLSGLQSLISIYLLSLWILTYFGHLFETV